jgi:hypothetical protein
MHIKNNHNNRTLLCYKQVIFTVSIQVQESSQFLTRLGIETNVT